MQNRYSLDNRTAEPVLDYCRENQIGFIPWFPIGGGKVSGEDVLANVAEAHGVGVRQVALAWLLHHADNILLIPGTSSADHLEENMAGVEIELTADEMTALDRIGSTGNPTS